MHSLILGSTESGKTTLARKIARKLSESGHEILVLDPIFSGDAETWSTRDVYTSPENFLPVFWNTHNRFVFIDESDSVMRRAINLELVQTGMRGRHNGHSVTYITHFRTDLLPALRSQCSQLFLFSTGSDDAYALAQEWRCSELEKAPDLAQGQFYWVRRFWHGKSGQFQKLSAFVD